jgi:hypothetical protein
MPFEREILWQFQMLLLFVELQAAGRVGNIERCEAGQLDPPLCAITSSCMCM